ncbi:sporulation membrane protein YtaF [Clostridium cochlearium]|uniref:Sporulation membrane protein YtaF n=1 Tax=Clostridium cochlearium TaxID=1494 RepID=A0A7Y3V568_CLOCO|nr:sporulation membrane protein YtaF [Clostridium cochlearium]NOH14923.1 sporulation membrane protein YtaF [Clostridium cochlearium]
MSFLSILIFAISSSCDSFIIGISYGINKIKINFSSNLLVALISGLGTFLSMLPGAKLINYISPTQANKFGSLLLILVGICLLINSLRKKDKLKEESSYSTLLKNPEKMDFDSSKNIEIKEAIYLGVFLCLNNIGLGIMASIIGLNIYITSFLSFLFSLTFLKLGCFIGKKVSAYSFNNKIAEISSYVLIILLGIWELFS